MNLGLKDRLNRRIVSAITGKQLPVPAGVEMYFTSVSARTSCTSYDGGSGVETPPVSRKITCDNFNSQRFVEAQGQFAGGPYVDSLLCDRGQPDKVGFLQATQDASTDCTEVGFTIQNDFTSFLFMIRATADGATSDFVVAEATQGPTNACRLFYKKFDLCGEFATTWPDLAGNNEIGSGDLYFDRADSALPGNRPTLGYGGGVNILFPCYVLGNSSHNWVDVCGGPDWFFDNPDFIDVTLTKNPEDLGEAPYTVTMQKGGSGGDIPGMWRNSAKKAAISPLTEDLDTGATTWVLFVNQLLNASLWWIAATADHTIPLDPGEWTKQWSGPEPDIELTDIVETP